MGKQEYLAMFLFKEDLVEKRGPASASISHVWERVEAYIWWHYMDKALRIMSFLGIKEIEE